MSGEILTFKDHDDRWKASTGNGEHHVWGDTEFDALTNLVKSLQSQLDTKTTRVIEPEQDLKTALHQFKVADAAKDAAYEINDAKSAEVERLAEWKKEILKLLKHYPEFDEGKWSGDKEGRGYCFELIAHFHRDRKRLLAGLVKFGRHLPICAIFAWEMRIQGPHIKNVAKPACTCKYDAAMEK